MKCSKAETLHKSLRLPALRFEDQQLTSFSGLIVFQRLFTVLELRERLRLCFRHLPVSPIFGHARIVLVLIIDFLLGYRQLRELRFYADDQWSSVWSVSSACPMWPLSAGRWPAPMPAASARCTRCCARWCCNAWWPWACRP